ncbi:MAG: RidA family protein [Rhodospirillales bacterium]|jgi:enamine deaminase RidA (YjgF/YER057c/UK114 family)|nr:RidA family protein [Rhodospirillales bacterium]
MAGKIEARLKELGIELPGATAPAANYIPYVVSGKLIFISGQITLLNGKIEYIGKIGDTFSIEEGYQAARLCGLNLISQAKAAAGGDLDKIKRVVKLGGFVNAVPGFSSQPEIINGASDLMVEVFGENGRHARAAVSAADLPRNVAVEIEGIFELV